MKLYVLTTLVSHLIFAPLLCAAETSPRVVVTGLDDKGRSVFVSDGAPKLLVSNGDASFMGDLWKTESLPVTNQDGFPPVSYSLEPQGAGGVSFRIASIPPTKTPEPDIKDTSETGMHQTDTIDFITIIEGEMHAMLDSGQEVLLKKGDTLVQRGTNHAWVNRSGKPCLFSAVMVKPAISTSADGSKSEH